MIDEFSIESLVDKGRSEWWIDGVLLGGEERRGEKKRKDSSSWAKLLVIRGLGWQTLASFPLFAIFARWIVLRFHLPPLGQIPRENRKFLFRSKVQ